MEKKIKIGIIGLGNMGTAILRGLVKKLNRANLFGYDKDREKNKIIKKNLKINICESIEDLVKKSKVTFLCVKPQDLKEVLKELEKTLSSIKEKKIFISIAAGIPLKFLEKYLKNNPVIRVMPNLGAKVFESLNAYSCGKFTKEDDEKIGVRLLNSFGVSIKVKESFLDKITALSGSGLAYFFYFFEALEESAKKLGFSESDSKFLVYQTMKASLKLLESENLDAQSLRKKVTSKKGTTERAIKIFKENKFKEIVYKAVRQAQKRAKELSKEVLNA